MTSATSAKDSKTKVRWPAEWEPHAATLLSWPHNPDTWPGCLAEAESEFIEIVRLLAEHETMHINVLDAAMRERVESSLAGRGVDGSSLQFHEIPTDDAWIRDHGPIAVARGNEIELLDFEFNAWGGKYPPWERDNAVPARLAAALGLPGRSLPWVLEAGSIDGNGAGCILTTESCLLNANRGEDRSREAMERRLAEALGARQVIWLADGIEGDDTDGHIDDIARFVGPKTIAAVLEEAEADPNAAALRANWERLQGARTHDGDFFELVALPMPPPVEVRGSRVPASYANFYIANSVVLVPVFGAPSDKRALGILRECFPGREVVGVPSRSLVAGLGAVHCLTQQLPQASL
ncbi:MAG: agmatine deiminase family protein [Deltaproteobacteria bacterium]|nr:agmatine deiminase family protein [Deltaproteobacteria bacterium]